MKARFGFSRAFLAVCGLVFGACGGAATDTTTAPAATTTTTAAPAAATTTAPAQGERQVVVDSAIEFADEQWLDVHYPAEPGPWPVVVLVHGLDVPRDAYGPPAGVMAEAGLVVFNVSVDYRDAGTFQLTFPTSIAQEACAIRFARVTAADYGGDPDRIILAGHSAGASTGIVAAMAGDDFVGDCTVAEGSSLPYGFVGYEGPYNWSIAPGPLNEGIYVSDAGMWEQIDPYGHVGGNPTLVVKLVHGDLLPDGKWDVPLQHSEDMYRALSEAGYEAELVVIEDAGHMLFDTAIESILEVASS